MVRDSLRVDVRSDSSRRGEIVFLCPDLHEKPADLGARIAQAVQSVVEADKTIATCADALAAELNGDGLSWTEPHFARTGQIGTPNILRANFNTSRQLLTIQFKTAQAAEAAPWKPSSMNPNKSKAKAATAEPVAPNKASGEVSALAEYSSAVSSAVLDELSRFVDVQSLLDALPESQRRTADSAVHSAAQAVLERFQNIAYARGLNAGATLSRAL